ncbi:hypothetical protein [Trueperella pecoris]|uniref:Carrier domain-containing protein n=1 Tax=Trueperella pecoris TaxID=2733571 RepID=A0A7M1QY67_9ACTO|nr:hypothetical protein [Trueperella pecoris]QOR46404.1 hypothetical protein INS88_04170 [Trueperella pecoris]QTG76228.1 hypothetical protein J4179_04080 [Trueperella pecoris]
MVDRHDLALARARVLLSDIAPEIPEADIVAEANLTDDLRLDLVSVWALANGLEKLAKVEILDADICAARTLGDLLEHALTDVPLDFRETNGSPTQSPQPQSGNNSAAETPTDPALHGDTSQPAEVEDGQKFAGEDDLNAAMQDLAALFNN